MGYVQALQEVTVRLCNSHGMHDTSKVLAVFSTLLLETEKDIQKACATALSAIIPAAVKHDAGYQPIVVFCKALLDYKYKIRWRNIFKNVIVVLFKHWSAVRQAKEPAEVQGWTAAAWGVGMNLVQGLIEVYES